jgi:hypothetical protein
VFLLEYPLNDPRDRVKGSHIPNHESEQKIIEKLLDLPGCKEVNGPYINGIVAITVDDTDGAAQYTDDQWREKIVSVFLRYWRD